jgi:transposase
MGKTNRNDPLNAKSSDARYTLMDFSEEFPDDTACLEFLVAKLYPEGMFCPKCDRVTKHHRIKQRTCYGCQFCGHQEYPLKGTIFEGSSTSLKLWFYAMYLMASTRCGISAKQIERETGVTYPTAWRMFNKIRSMLDQDYDAPFEGFVEADETFIGGIAKWRKGPKLGRGTRNKDVVFGVAQRATATSAGKVKATIVRHNDAASLIPQVQTKVLPASTVYTDELRSYMKLDGLGYTHKRVSHSMKVYVSGDAHTNTIEGFWSLLKKGISGVYHGVSTEHLQSYLDEYVFRYNNREITGRRGMFDAFLSRIEKASPQAAS